MNTTQIGDITEYKFILYCLEHNIPVCKPVSNNLPYDVIIELNGKLLKIQIKTGYNAKNKNSFQFNTRSTSKNYNEIVDKNYKGLIDGFITCYKELPGEFFYIPIEKATKGHMCLYFGKEITTRRNNAYDYDFKKMWV